MLYEILRDAPGEELVFQTAEKARRARGILWALGPVVAPLVPFTLTPFFGEGALRATALALVAAAALGPAAYFLGRSGRLSVRARRGGVLSWDRRGAFLAESAELPLERVEAFEARLLMRTLGADKGLFVKLKEGEAWLLAEGDPHSGQIAALRDKMRALLPAAASPSPPAVESPSA
jgi:hypothetical protein